MGGREMEEQAVGGQRKAKVGQTTEIGELIRNRRKKIGLSQRDLGKKLGISQNTVSEIEKRKGRYPKADRIKKLSKALGIPEGNFFRLIPAELPHTEFGKFVRGRLKELEMSEKIFAQRMGMKGYGVKNLLNKEEISRRRALKLVRVLSLEITAFSSFIKKKHEGGAGSPLGLFILNRRNHLEMTAEELGEKIGTRRQYVAILESGGNGLCNSNSRIKIKLLAKALEVEEEAIDRLRFRRRRGQK